MPPLFRSSLICLLLFVGLPRGKAGQPITVGAGSSRVAMMDVTMAAQALWLKGEAAAAKVKLDAVIKADPTFFPAYYIRAQILAGEGKDEEALRDCNEALKKDSTFAEAALLRARINYSLGRCAASAKEIDHVISIRARQDALARAYGERARLHLVCAENRDPAQALKDATMACKLFAWQDESMIDTLAMANAANGDFDAAIQNEERALARKDLRADESRRLRQHLSLFKQHRSP